MADFATLEESVEESRPLDVYDFALGSDTYRFTSDESDVTVDGYTYAAEAIRRGNPSQSQESRDDIFEVRVPRDNAFALLYIGVVPGQQATLTIRRLQRDESPVFDTTPVFFKGFVQSVRFPDGGDAVIGAKSIEAMASRIIPRYTYQGQCNHVLYDNDCGVNQDSFKHIGTVTAVSGNTITVSGASGFANGYFNAGYVKPSTLDDFRMVLDHTGDVLTLLLPFPGSLVGIDVSAFAGCDHMIDGHCDTRYNNVIEFGGFAFVPEKNPFETEIV